MDAATLKAKTLHTWREFHKLHECVIPGEEAFLAEVRQYGELDQPQTWQKAWASLYAKFMADTPVLDEPAFFVEFYLIQSAQKEDWADLMPLMLQKLAEIPATLNALLEGIADIRNHGSEYGTGEQQVKEFMGVVDGMAIWEQQQQLTASANEQRR